MGITSTIGLKITYASDFHGVDGAAANTIYGLLNWKVGVSYQPKILSCRSTDLQFLFRETV